MLYLNFSTAEELVFEDAKAQAVLPPHTFSMFEQWRLARRIPFLRDMGKQAVLDLLNNLTDEDVAALEGHFGEKIVVERLNYSVAVNYKVPLADANVCEALCDISGFGYFGTWRDDEYLYITFWR
jgi:hypothetical protein